MTARKHPQLKLLCGTARHDRPSSVTTLPPLDGAPAPPAWLPLGRATTEWARLAPILTANRLLTDGNMPLLANLCALHAKLAEIWSSGGAPTAALLNAYRALSGELGLLSMRLPAPAATPNRFAELARRRR